MVKIKRKISQIIFAVSTNSYFKGYIEGKIYRGGSKRVCVPGMNCYSCPGALGSCPIGLQAVIGSMKYTMSYYIIGFITLIGIIFGRFICGWMCPFGLIEDLLYKIPLPKIKIKGKFKNLKYLKYVFLVGFVLFLPIIFKNEFGVSDPYFCKYVCPVGTIEGGIPLITMNKSLRYACGLLFRWKLFISISIVIISMVIFRPFCRFICPLGAIYSLFNRISFYKIEVDHDECTSCGLCVKKCDMDIEVFKNPNSSECIRRGKCKAACPRGALTSGIKFR